jgi:hypothetical protein
MPLIISPLQLPPMLIAIFAAADSHRFLSFSPFDYIATATPLIIILRFIDVRYFRR